MENSWFKWYPASYRAATMHLTPEQDGIYRRLIDHYIETQEPLRDNPGSLAQIAMVSESSIRSALTVLAPLLGPSVNGELLVSGLSEFSGTELCSDLRLGRQPAKCSKMRDIVFHRDGYSCTYCESTDRLEYDHIHPLAKGGSHDLSNLTTSCAPCNRSKGAKLLSEWRA